MNILINQFLQGKTIVSNTHEKQDSIACREWLMYLNNPNICRKVPLTLKEKKDLDIHKSKIGKPTRYYNLKRPFTVD